MFEELANKTQNFQNNYLSSHIYLLFSHNLYTPLGTLHSKPTVFPSSSSSLLKVDKTQPNNNV